VVTVAGGVGGAAGGGGESLIAYGIIAMIAAADALPLEVALAIGALGVLAVEVGGVVFSASAGTMLGFPLLLGVGLLVGRNRAAYRTQAEQARALLEQNELLRAEQRRADVLDERARIAREIHDVLAHSLGALGIQLQTVKALFTVHDDPERAFEALGKAQRMASEGLTETRRAVHALRTDTLPLHEEVARTGAEHADRHHVLVRCQTSGTPLALSPEATVALLRIAQEALVNAAKHAPGKDVDLRVDYRSDGVRVSSANDLPGGTSDEASADTGRLSARLQTLDAGYGLTGMRERLRLVHGNLDVGIHGGRWVVEADLPLVSGTASRPSSSSPSTRKDLG
jgi:signal transduction histidine kinase